MSASVQSLRMLMLAVFAALILAQSPPAVPSDVPPHRDASLPIEIPQWLASGEHQDTPWKVHIEKPVLTYQERQVVKAVAKINGPALQEKSIHRELMFIIRVADENGRWLPGGNFVNQELGRSFNHDVEMETEVLLRPGKYRIASILYDSVLDEHNVSFNSIEIPEVSHDPLPQMLRKTPQAEFVRGDTKGIDTFAPGHAYLPLDDHRPIQIDLLVDLSGRERHMHPSTIFSAAPGDTTFPTRFNRLRDVSYFVRLLQSATVLASMKANQGCMLVSAFNATKHEVVLKPTWAESVDWEKVHDTQVGPDKDTISVSALERRKDVPQFIQNQFDALMGSPSCYEGSAKPLRIVLVLTHGLQFPDGSRKTKIGSCDCKLFYLRQAETPMMIDDLKGMFSDLGPRVFEYSDPDHFRQKLADLIKEIDAIAK